MHKINSITWKLFLLKDLFKIETGTDLIYNEQDEGIYPVIGHKELNHGVTCWIQKLSSRKLYDHNRVLSLGDRGCFISYVQPYDFYIGTRVKALILKHSKPNIFVLTFISAIINNERYRFNYNRNATDKTPYLAIKLPSIMNSDGSYSPDWHYMEDYIRSLHYKPLLTKNKNCRIPELNLNKWKNFKLSDLFRIEPTKGTTTDQMEDGNEIPYVAATRKLNGFAGLVSKDGNASYISKGNAIVIIQIGDGGTGYATYHSNDFIGMQGKTSACYNPRMNKYSGLFITSILCQERFRYSFGRSWTGDRLKNTIIKLPAITKEDGTYEPDWEYMENYIKSLPYGDRI